jgi:hypothetical protein
MILKSPSVQPPIARVAVGGLLAVCLATGLAGCGGGGGGGANSTAGGSTVTTVPGAPTIGSATAGNASASIAFTAPASNGGATITGYTATCSATGQATRTGTGTASPVTVATLINGTTYACSVTATNAVGTGAASSTVNVTPVANSSGTGISTASVLCPLSISTPVTLGNGASFTSTANWVCSGTSRVLTGNGIPNHTTGVFPNGGNPNTISAQSISFTTTTAPVLTTTQTNQGVPGYALNSVKFEPGTAGTCASTVTAASQCNLANGAGGTWRVEALGQTAFDFGVDSNNAHVQPTGQYHYHGVPAGLLTNAGNTGQTMTLVGWAVDGYPIYARYGYVNPLSATSGIRVIRGSYALDTTPDAGRPSTTIAPLGSFTSDWNYVAGSGDLDACNGRFGVTPEFPNGTYHYYVTDTYPFMQRCVMGSL